MTENINILFYQEKGSVTHFTVFKIFLINPGSNPHGVNIKKLDIFTAFSNRVYAILSHSQQSHSVHHEAFKGISLTPPTCNTI